MKEKENIEETVGQEVTTLIQEEVQLSDLEVQAKKLALGESNLDTYLEKYPDTTAILKQDSPKSQFSKQKNEEFKPENECESTLKENLELQKELSVTNLLVEEKILENSVAEDLLKSQIVGNQDEETKVNNEELEKTVVIIPTIANEDNTLLAQQQSEIIEDNKEVLGNSDSVVE